MTFPTKWLARTAARPLVYSSSRRRLKEGNGLACQSRVFRSLVARYSKTEYGRQSGISAGMREQEFSARVPTRTYEGLVPWVERTLQGEADILWPGTCEQFAVSSGTTAGRTKYLPITAEMIAHFRRTGLESLACFSARAGSTDVFSGRHLFLGGSTVLEAVKRPAGKLPAVAGDLSGITALKLPRWVEAMLYEPGREIAQMADWPAKIRAIAQRTVGCDITLLAGIPSWVLVLVEELKKQERVQGRDVSTLRDIWPNLRCLIHGGVPIGPYLGELRGALGNEVCFHEVYPASEAFIGVQDGDPEEGLRLLVDAGVYYEFAPLSCYDEQCPEALALHAVPLEGVRCGEDYVILLSTPAGLCRYIIGDVVRFLSTEVPRLVYAGRTRLQLSAFGEHVIEKELTDSLTEVSERLGMRVSNFHVAPCFMDSSKGLERGRHEWWIAVGDPRLQDAGMSELPVLLDQALSRRNDDYEAKRRGGGLTVPTARIVRPEVFERWQKDSGRWGGQNKMPRCRSDRVIADALSEINLSL